MSAEGKEEEDRGSPFSPLASVREFHEKFGLPIGSRPALPDDGERELRWELLAEEVKELRIAEDEDDIVEIADALGDIVSVVYGTALSYGIDLDAVIAEIHRSNMTKTRDESVQYPAKNVRKLDGYESPRIAKLIFDAQRDAA